MRKHKRFRVWAMPQASDDDMDYTCLAVQGPHMNEFAFMDEVAARMQNTLNAPTPPLTAAERDAICTAIGLVLADETPESWSTRTVAALRRAHAKLGG